VPGKGVEWGAQSEHTEEKGVVPAKETGDGKEAGQRRMMYAALNEDFLYQALFTE
jgi:hypothetical protein